MTFFRASWGGGFQPGTPDLELHTFYLCSFILIKILVKLFRVHLNTFRPGISLTTVGGHSSMSFVFKWIPMTSEDMCVDIQYKGEKRTWLISSKHPDHNRKLWSGSDLSFDGSTPLLSFAALFQHFDNILQTDVLSSLSPHHGLRTSAENSQITHSFSLCLSKTCQISWSFSIRACLVYEKKYLESSLDFVDPARQVERNL